MSSYNMTQYNDEQWDYVKNYIKDHKKLLFKYGFNRKKFINHIYVERMNYELDFNSPKTLNEKINVFKYKYKKYHKKYWDYTDKNKVRDYVKYKVGEKYLIPQLFCKKRLTVKDIEKLPNSFVLKTNQGSGTNYIVKDKSKEDYSKICDYMNSLLKIKYQYIWGEFHYEKIHPMIVAEKLLINSKGSLPDDIKCFCFNNNGEKHKVFFVDRVIGDERYRKWFDEDWKELEIKTCFNQLKDNISKPKKFNELKNVVDKLSEDFNFVRVDMFIHGNNIYFGELTFTPSAGYLEFGDKNTDLLWGSWIGDNEL